MRGCAGSAIFNRKNCTRRSGGEQDLVSHRQPLRDASATGAGIRVQKYLHGVIFTLSDVFEFKS